MSELKIKLSFKFDDLNLRERKNTQICGLSHFYCDKLRLPVYTFNSLNKPWPHVTKHKFSSTFVTLLLIRSLTVANINTCESDGKQNSTAAVTEAWSSASLPLCGEYLGLFPCAVSWLSSKVSFLSRFLHLFLEELCLELSRAIEAGDAQAASQHASALARQKTALTIQPSQKNYAEGEVKWGPNGVDLKSFMIF